MKRLFVIVVFQLTSSCSVGIVSPALTIPIASATPDPMTVITNALTPSRTLAPSSTAKPLSDNSSTVSLSPTLSPPLGNGGPYLVYTNMRYPIINFILLNPDGGDQKVIMNTNDSTKIIDFSPNGEWGVLVNNVIDWGDVFLRLIHFPEGAIQDISPIILKETRRNYFWDDCPEPILLYSQTAWSPDGRILAFAANISGTSFDLFTYDIETGTIRRLTNDSADVLSINWSPDSKTIYYINGNQPDGIGNYVTYAVNATKPDNQSGQGIQTIITSTEKLLLKYVVDNYFLITLSYEEKGCNAGGGGYPKGTVNVVNLATEENTIVWSGYIFLNVAVDPTNNRILLYGDEERSNLPLDLYLVSFKGDILSHLDIGNFNYSKNVLMYRGGNKYTFLIYGNEESGVLGITSDGTVEKISDREDASVFLSPTKDLFIVCNHRGMDLFSRDDQIINTLKIKQASPLLWHPDEKGMYFRTIESDNTWRLNYWDLENNRIILLKECQISDSDCGFYHLSWFTR